MQQTVVRTKRGDEARLKILEGIQLVSDFVKITIGPKGRNVAFNQVGPLPTRIINDGKTIAEKLKSSDPFIQAGVEMAQEVCNKTDNNAGDGTSQTAFMSYVISKYGYERVQAGENPVDIKRELEEDVKSILKKLKEISIPVTTSEQVKQVATISGNNDKEIGEAVSSITKEIGLKASIIIEKGNEEALRTEIVKGLWFDKGYVHPTFMTDTGRGVAEYENPLIFIINDDLMWVDDITDFVDKLIDQKLVDKKIIFIAKEIEGECLATMAKTHYERMVSGKGMNILAVEAPFIGPDQKEFMEDLAIYTGGKIIGQSEGAKLSDIEPMDYAGTCDKIVATSKNTTILGGSGKEEDINKRLDSIKALLSQKSKSEKITSEKLEQRIDSLSSGVGIIYTGGATEIEIKDRFLRLEDSVKASKAAIKRGIVAGGGITYLNLIKVVKSDILKKAFTAVTTQVAINAGEKPVKIIDAFDITKPFVGFNANTGEFEDMIEAGVIDPTLVIENVIINSISLASSFLTTDGLIVQNVEDDGKK